MAQKVETWSVCDSGHKSAEHAADRSFRYCFDGTDYEIDLCDTEAEKFEKQMAAWVGSSRKVTIPHPRGHKPQRTRDSREQSQRVRAWAKEQGIKVNERGRVPDNVAQMYREALTA